MEDSTAAQGSRLPNVANLQMTGAPNVGTCFKAQNSACAGPHNSSRLTYRFLAGIT